MNKKIDYVTIYEVVNSLIGEIEPVGSTHIDEQRFRNLKTCINLMNMLVDDILFLLKHEEDYRASVKAVGEFSRNELTGLVETLSEVLGDESID